MLTTTYNIFLKQITTRSFKYVIFVMLTTFCRYNCSYYSFSGSTLPSHIKTVAIPTFKDETPEFGIREQLTRAVIELFNDDPNLNVIGSKSSDSIIRGEILNISDEPHTFGKDETTTQYKFVIAVKITFEDLKRKNIIFQETLSTFSVYEENNRESGIEEAIIKLSEDIINKIIAGW